MRILAIESSARNCSAAIVNNDKLVCEVFADTGLTHSQTLMQMVNLTLNISKTALKTIDLITVSSGPGSYTGIRIGIAAAKGLAHSSGIKCIGISTLESIAYNFFEHECYICSIMDARCGQVYSALFKCRNNSVVRITDDAAMSCFELQTMLNDISNAEHFVLAGDGAEMFYKSIDNIKAHAELAPLSQRYQCAHGVALAASNKPHTAAGDLQPFYLRAPQAERELKKAGEKN